MDRVDSAIQAAKDGDNDTARGMLKDLLKEDVDNERAWLWLSQVVENDAERRLCLRQVLRINPQQRDAQRGLSHLGTPAAAEADAVEPRPEPADSAVTMRSVREAGEPPEQVARPEIESPKAPRRMPPAAATRRAERRRSKFLPILLGLAGVAAVVLVVFIVTTRLGGVEQGTDVAAEGTLSIQVVEETPDQVPITQLTEAPQPTEPAATATQPEPTQSPATPVPVAPPASQPVASSGVTDAEGTADLVLHDGTTAEVHVVSPAGEPIAGSDIAAISNSTGLTLVAVAPGCRPYAGTWRSEASTSASTARAPSPSEAPFTIELAPETDLYMAESDAALDDLLSLPDRAPGWMSSRVPAGEICAVLGSSDHAYRTLLASAVSPLGPHFVLGFAGGADAEAWCAQALPVKGLPGELAVIWSDEMEALIALWSPAGVGVVYGRVEGDDGLGITGATVRVAETSLSATTLPHGWYYLPARETMTLTLTAAADELSGGQVQVGAVAGQVVKAPLLEVVPAESVAAEAPSPESVLATYWDCVDGGRFDAAWVLLTPRFQEERFGGSVDGFRQHYADMVLCRVVAEEARLLEQDGEDVIVAARMLYEKGTFCMPEAHRFDFRFVYDSDRAAWLLDDSAWQGLSQ